MDGAKRVGDRLQLVGVVEREHLAARRQRVIDAAFGWIDLDQLPLNSAREYLTQRLSGLEAVSARELHTPRGDLAEVQLAERQVSEGGDRFAKQPTQFGRRLGLSVVLKQVLGHQSGKRHR